ncbi:MAG: Phosphoglycerate transporter protein [Syntrophaceae bacterium PtaU1.Bin231]|nr:MAG: Phosphoglycerate transporter protein [Syntrophaceae bacterium PtaU1.Bin231]HOG16254.1 MFS transporter [Syntrophales bacterium]
MKGIRSLLTGSILMFLLAHFGHHLVSFLTTPLLPYIRAGFQLDYTASGMLVSAFSVAYGFAQLPAGWLADRVRPSLLITIGISGVALAGLLVSLTHDYWTMAVLLALMGILGGGYHPATPPLISAAVEPEIRGRSLGIHNIGGGLSHVAGPFIAVAIAGLWGWRSAYMICAVPTIIFGLLFHRILKRLEEKAVASRSSAAAGRAASLFTGERASRLWTFVLLSTSTQAVLISVIPFVPLMLVDQFGVDKESAVYYLVLVYSAGLWISPFGGYLCDRFGSIPVLISVCLLTVPVIYLLNVLPYGPGTALLLFLIGVIIYVRMPISEAFIVGEAPVEKRSTMLGIYYFAGMEAGGVLTPVMGNLIDRIGFAGAFQSAAGAVLVVTLICSLLLRRRR